MNDPRLNPDYRGVKCPTCGERLPMLFGEQCNHCNLKELQRLRAERSELQAQVDALQQRVHLVTQYDALETLGRRLWRQINGDEEFFEDAVAGIARDSGTEGQNG